MFTDNKDSLTRMNDNMSAIRKNADHRIQSTILVSIPVAFGCITLLLFLFKWGFKTYAICAKLGVCEVDLVADMSKVIAIMMICFLNIISQLMLSFIGSLIALKNVDIAEETIKTFNLS